jgi:hypothetical protein
MISDDPLVSQQASRSARPPDPEVETPARIGDRYRVISELGRGGMAVVYRVRDAAADKDVALKRLITRQDSAVDRETRALFEREFYTLAQLKHPSVIEVYDYGVDAIGPYYTMEWLDGGDLSARAPLDFRLACEVTMQVCSSLSLLHSRRLLHRDISPRNIRCTLAGRAKLIDFGAMVPMGAGAAIVGTPAFTAPEVLHLLSLDARTDLFSLGATLYFAVTGRAPFAARTFGDLAEAWSREPVPPSQIVAGIPASLDALLFSLLSIEPARRPSSAFEVMQRLSAIAEIAIDEADTVSQAYLLTPPLVARETEQRSYRQRMRRAVQGHGEVISIESGAGLGRSRLLDAFALEGKALGATVLRVAGRSAREAAFAAALTFAEQLLQALPEVALRCAKECGLDRLLFSVTEPANEADGPRVALLPLASLQIERLTLQAALTGWLELICHERPLMIAVDDAERVDEASLALLAGLAHAGRNGKLLIALCLRSPVVPGEIPALDILRAQATTLQLKALSPSESEDFFRALFGDVPQVALVADRIFKIAAGNPGESMALAQHMLDRHMLRYTDGHWVLPGELSVSDLPANAEEALRVRLRALSALSRRLAETQALALKSAWTRADYAQIIGAAEHANIDEALNSLLSQGVLVGDGRVYTLVHQTMRGCLIALLTAAEIAQRHAVLAEFSVEQRGRPELLTVRHLMGAGADERALDTMSLLLSETGAQTNFSEQSTMEPKDIAATLARIFDLAQAHGRPQRMVQEIARHLVLLSMIVDSQLYDRYAASWLAQVERDAGLVDYRACDPTLDPAARLQSALTQTLARYTATAEAERVYRIDEAIKFLAVGLSTSIVIGVRSRDSRLLESLPGRLEPFAGLSPLLYALWQNLLAATEMNYRAQPLRARARVLDVYNLLGKCSEEELQFVSAIRHAVCFALGALDVNLGYASATTWIEVLDQDPLQRVNAMYLRQFQCLYDGKPESAERYRARAEVLSVQASARQMFDRPAFVELTANVHARDLRGVKLVAERLARSAANEPRLGALLLLARGMYQRLRGDFGAALAAFDASLELENPSRSDPPPWLDTWRLAAAGKIAVLTELDRAAEAQRFGAEALEAATRAGLETWSHEIVRELALAEAKQGDLAGAARRLDALIAERADLTAAHLAVDYEARACVAIWAKDTLRAAHFASLAVRGDQGGSNLRLVRQSRLLDEVRAAGLDVSVLPTMFESSVLSDAGGAVRRAAATKVTAALRRVVDPAGRVLRALELLCEAAACAGGQLYLSQDAGLVRAATLGMSAAAASALDEFAVRHWALQLDGEMDTDVIPAGSEPGTPALETWTSADGTAHRVAVLKSAVAGSLLYVGLIVLLADGQFECPPQYWELSAAIGTRLYELGDAQGVIVH